MYTPAPVCSNLPPPNFNGPGPLNVHYFNNSFVGSYAQPFNAPFSGCNTHVLRNTPPPGFNGFNIQAANPGPTPLPACESKPPMQFNQPPPGYCAPFTHPPFNSPTPGFPSPSVPYPNSSFPPPVFQNYSVFTPPPSNQFSAPPPHIPRSNTPQTLRANQSCDEKCTPPGPRSFHKHDRTFKQEKIMPFHCESCDRDFVAKNQYDKHVAQHLTCRLEGCTFTAHPKIVEKHILMQHSTGLFSRIPKNNSPEEIDKWISERKKNYPTLNRVEEKRAQREEMEKRGERYNDRPRPFNNRNRNSKAASNRLPGRSVNGSSSFKQRAWGQKFNHSNRNKSQTEGTELPVRKRNFGNFNRTSSQNEGTELSDKKRASPVDGDEEEDCVQRNLPAFRGIDPSSSSNDTTAEKVNLVLKVTASSLELIQGYDSVDDSEEDESVISSVPSSSVQKSSVLNEEENDSDGSAPEECSSKIIPLEVLAAGNASEEVEMVAPEASVDAVTESSKKQTRQRKRRRNDKSESADPVEDDGVVKEADAVKKRPILQTYRRYRPPTLLEKLLAPEINHERNVILQCVRYVVSNNYFGIGQEKSDSRSSST